jgi:hypothetical protein
MNKPISEIAADLANEDKSDRCSDRWGRFSSALAASLRGACCAKAVGGWGLERKYRSTATN